VTSVLSMQYGPIVTLCEGFSRSSESSASEPMKNLPPEISIIPAGQLGLGAGSGLSQLASTRQQLGNNDATSLAGIGQQQQDLEQKGYDTGYNEFLNQRDWDWNQLGKVQGAVNGVQLPTGATASTSQPAPGAGYGASPLQWVTAIGGLAQAFGP